MAMACPESFSILGITTVGGNVCLERVTQNALGLCALAGRFDIPVYAGCPRPMVVEASNAAEAHGESGIGGASLPLHTLKRQPQHAVHFLIEQLRASSQPITLVCSAPLTNIALALIQAPDIKMNISEILVMGGSMTSGNRTPAAEFNFYCDPHAAHVVFTSGLPITMIGLDITHQVCATPERISHLRASKSDVGQQVAAMLEAGLDFDRTCFGLPGRAVHDACLSAYVLRPDLFKAKPAHVNIETLSSENRGASIISFYPRFTHESRTKVVYDVDADGVFDLILATLARYT